jgi:RimJ/RimL family protein N-acetyltransferase/L-amino acid N-acyltransferase YncA
MQTIHFRPAEPDRDFAQLAAWFTSIEDEVSTESGLKEYYEKQKERTTVCIAEDEHGERLGFYWASRDKTEPDRTTFTLFVRPDQRGQGIGRQLYDEMFRIVPLGAKRLRVIVADTSPEDRAFAERRGFIERTHHFGMELNLATFDDRPYNAIIAKLQGEGFQFTSMDALGNTEEAQRKLYLLNDTASASTPGTEGEHPWLSFEDFQKSVCQSDWYKPGGQMVVIDAATGAWAAMSAITRMKGNDYAYNLFTGVDLSYRGRKLGQAVKVLALRYAREVLKVDKVRTHHNTFNLPMIAIDRKLGYVPLPGTFRMEKVLE